MAIVQLPPDRRTARPRADRALVRLAGSLSLVLPAHNEEGNIELVVEDAVADLPRFVDDFEIIVVDDGSRDATGRLAEELARRHPAVRVIHHPQNRGYGAALTSGFRATTRDYVMFMDADRQFDINDLALLTPFAGSFDIVAGFRMERNDPFHRRVFAEVFNVTVRVLFGVHLRDIDCAFKLFRGDLLRSMDLTAPGALINTEIQAKARRQGATIEQVGVHHYRRVVGTPTGGSWRVIARAMRETIVLWWRMRSYEPPTTATRPRSKHFLGDAVVAGSALGGLAALSVLIRRAVRRNDR